MPTEPTSQIGHYRLGALVARGGMAEIWRAMDERSGEPVAIKRLLLDEGEPAPESHAARLVREAQAHEQLAHENIVRYLEAGFDAEGLPFIALEWLEGEDLASRHRRAPLDLGQVVDIVRQALRGLAASHVRGVTHRDIKPANLFLVADGDDDGIRVKLLDFGLALRSEDANRLTRAGQIMGTLYYLSPEQAQGAGEVDPRTDLYSMGVLLYELCTGKLPFSAQQPAAVLLKIITETPPRPRQLRPDLPLLLEAVILRAMQRSPRDRFASAEEMLEALDRVAERSLALEATPAELPAAPTSALEYRLVSLLCVVPAAPGFDLAEVTEAVEAEGGAVHRLLGGQMMGLFGLDRTIGDEALRAVRAGLAVREGVGVRVRLLAATVHVDVGEDLQLDTGDLDQTLATISDQPPGALVLDEHTVKLVEGKVEIEQLGARRVASELAAEPITRRLVLGVETPTVGRETELASLQASLERTIDNEESEAVLLLGTAGIGKSRLCRDLLPHLEQRCPLCLVAQADSTRSETPYGLVASAVGRAAGVHLGQQLASGREALRAFVARHAPEAPHEEVATFIGEAVGVGFPETPQLQVARREPKVMSERVTWAFETLLEAAGQAGPTCLVLEDLHWADEESIQLCQQLIERLDRTSLFVLGTSRPELLERHPEIFMTEEASRIELAPLRRRPLRRLLRTLTGEEVSRELEDLVGRWCGGNPYFVEELVSWMVTKELLVRGADGWQLRGDPAELELPIGVEGAIQGRLDGLAPELKELLKGAAVLGEVFWAGGCEALGFSGAAEQLQRLERAEFVTRRAASRITGEAEWSFRHALLHQVAYQMLPRERRAPLHLLCAGWLESIGETDAALLARHFERGGDERRAAQCYARAGGRALSDGDLERAVACFQTSLAGPTARLEERHERMMGLARARILLGRYDEAWQDLDALEALGVDGGAEVPFMRGRVLYVRGRYQEAEATLGRAAAALGEQGDGDLRFEIRHSLFWVMWVQGRYDDARPTAELIHQQAVEDSRLDHLCAAKLCLSYCHKVGGDLSLSVRLAEEAVEHARELGHPFREVDALVFLGTLQELVGLYDEAYAALGAARALAARLKTVHNQASIEALLGRVSLAQQRVPEALAHYRAAIDRARFLGDDRHLAIALAGEARALCRTGERDDQEQALQAAQRALELTGDRSPPVEAKARLVLSEVNRALGRTEQAIDQALTAIDLLDRLGTQERYEIEILLAAHDALSEAGRTDEARELLERARRTLQERTRAIGDEAVRDSFARRVPYNLRAAGPDRS